jgi:PKD repeat protein
LNLSKMKKRSILLAILLLAILASPVSAMNWQTETVDDGSSYINPTWDHLTGKYTSLAFDSSGNPAISYQYYNAQDLKFAHYNNSSWEIETVDDVGQVGYYTSLAFDPSGNPAISYLDYINRTVKFADYNGVNWESETVESSWGAGLYTSLAFDSSGNPAISYYDEYWRNTSLKFAYYNGASWETETVDNIGDVGKYASLAFDSSDNPAISYYDFNTSYDLKFAHYNGANWEIETVDSRLNVGMGTSLCYDPSGYPAISYLDVTNKDLKFAHYNGIYWEIETVDSAAGLNTAGGEYTSLCFDASGNPAISYNDGNNDYLKFAYYNGANWEIETVDSAGAAGEYASLCFDSSGNAGISYYDYTDSHYTYLKFAFCMIGTLPVNSSVLDTWVYVDGINRSVQANTTLYLWPGTYNITVVKQDYETPVIQTVNVTEGANPEIDFIPEPAPPVAGFVVNTTSVTATQDIAFTDHSTGLISSWLWDFGDGITSTEQTPTHNYIATGIYNVSLVLTNPSGSSTRVRTSYVTVVDSPDAGFSANVTSGAVPLSVGFTDSSTNSPTSWLWDFGDGNTSTDQNPIHTYSAVGTYNVRLNASNDQGSNISTRISYIIVSTVNTGSSESGSSSSSSSSYRLSMITSQEQDAATITDNVSEEILEESVQAEENVSVIFDDEKTEETDTKETDAGHIKSTPDFSALAGIVFFSLAILVLEKINN